MHSFHANTPSHLPLKLTPNTHLPAHSQERNKDFIPQHLHKQFGFADVVFEGTTINCPSNSNLGTFKSNLRGNNAGQLATQIKQKGTTYITLKNGHTLTLEVCTKECSLQDSVAPKHFSDAAGGAIAATFIAVVLTGFILLMVIVVRYRR